MYDKHTTCNVEISLSRQPTTHYIFVCLEEYDKYMKQTHHMISKNKYVYNTHNYNIKNSITIMHSVDYILVYTYHDTLGSMFEYVVWTRRKVYIG